MKAFDELEKQTLKWVQPSVWRNIYELQTDDENADVLAQLKMHAWTSNADVEAVGNRWLFKRRGFWRLGVDVISQGTGDVYAQYRRRTLTVRDGREFLWKQVNFWGSKWAWLEPDENPIVGFQTGGAMKFNSDVRIDPESADQPVLPLLVMLGWYLLVQQRQAATTTAVIAAT